MSKDETKLALQLADAATRVRVGARYRHYKQLTYKVVSLALCEEGLEPCVVYQAEYGDQLAWVRPLSNWLKQIEVDGKKIDRFTLLA